MLANLRLAVIGAGVMGEAMIGGMLRQELVTPDQIIATEPREERRQEIAQRYGVRVVEDNVEAVRWAQVAIFSVKPQTLPRLLPDLRGTLGHGELVISIVAGAPIRQFVQGLEHGAIVRSMPNTPAQIGEGMTVWTAADEVSELQRGWAQTILGALGKEHYVADENYLDMATALSGSGPAYFFLLMEAMVDAGVHLGFPRYMAEELVLQTMLGSVRYALHSKRHKAELRNEVTSPGGTTAAAIYELEKGGLRTVITDAIWAAYRRAAELGKGK
jgi:pyrroline-5-carboxylate reductase